MKKQNKIKISKKLIVNIKYDLVQCKQINIACRIHLLNRKKRFLFNICNNNFQLAGSFNNTKFQCTSRVVFLWWLKQFVNKWRPLSQKAYQKSAYIYITKGQTEKSCRIFSRQWQFIANMDVKHSLIQWFTVNSYHTFHMMWFFKIKKMIELQLVYITGM